VRLLFDENLSAGLPRNLADIFPDSLHVRDIGLKSGSDRDIWVYAKANGLTVVTKDEDFHLRTIFDRSGPKVVWVRLGNCSARVVENLLRAERESILRLDTQPERCLILGLR
jgi:predicted nuclease of predicted toxin-antitoxin system